MTRRGILPWGGGLIGLWWVLFSLAVADARPPRSPLPPAPPPLRIGVFTLFRLQAVWLRTHERPTKLELAGRSLTLHPHTSYRVARTADGLAVRQAERQLAATTRLTLTADDVTVEVAGRKTRLQRRFCGRLTVAPAGGRLQLILTLPLETAAASVVGAELSPNAPVEAAKALAVVARSYLLGHVGRHADEGFDVCDSTHCQLFFGEQWVRQGATGKAFGERSGTAAQAAASTAGEVLRTADGRLHPAYFAACCGGATTTPAVAFGASPGVNDDGGGVVCRWCRGARFFTWTRRVDRRALARALLPETAATEDIQIEVAERAPGGFVTQVSIAVGARRVTLPNHRFRRLVGRRLGWNLVLSNRYAVESQGEAVVIHGHGFGHHVGLCLSGAVAQAQAGRDYRTILRHYFPTATCEAMSGSRAGDD